MGVPGYIGNPIIRFRSYFDSCHKLLQLYVWFGIMQRHGESDIKECEFFLAVNKNYLRPIWVRFLSGMVFRIASWWFIFRIIFRSVWHAFYSGFRNVDRWQLFVCTPKCFVPNGFQIRDAVNWMGETILAQVRCLRYDRGYRQWPLLAAMELRGSKY